MAVNNSLAKTTQQPKKFSNFIKAPVVMHNIITTLGSETRGKKFIAALVSAVQNNQQLQECDFGSLVNGGLLGENLNLSPSPQMGQYYLVPFNNTKLNTKVAQFQLGYKGYIQMAMRTGKYEKLIVLPVKEGELKKYDIFNEDFEFTQIEDPKERSHAKTIGYYAMFKLINGFTKKIYWTKEEMVVHADTYSQAFSEKATNGKYPKVSFEDYERGNYNEKDGWLYSSFWYKNFDAMACKTMLRQLISKWGIMSTEMEMAFKADMGEVEEVSSDDVKVNYVDRKDVIENDEEFAQPTPVVEEEPKTMTKDEEADFLEGLQ